MLENFLSQTRDQVSQNIKKSIGNSNLIEEAMSYSALADSKMIRAALINASGKINKKISDSSLLTLATGVELIHTYSLIHDDLPSMDDDDLRRWSNLAVSIVWGLGFSTFMTLILTPAVLSLPYALKNEYKKFFKTEANGIQ